MKEDKYGLYLRDFVKASLGGDDEPTDTGTTILTIQLTIDESLEPKWNVIISRTDPKPISQKDRRLLSFGVVGFDHEKDFQWGRVQSSRNTLIHERSFIVLSRKR